MEPLFNYYNTMLSIVAEKATEVFNKNYGLNLNKDDILQNLTDEIDEQPPVKEMAMLKISNSCIAVKQNKTKCTNKCISGHLYCGTHIRSEGKINLPQYIKMVADTLKYERVARVLSIGNILNDQDDISKLTQWPLEINNKSKYMNTYILFFTEFRDYFGAGILVTHFISPDKKKHYYMATHYIEANKYCEDLDSSLFTKISLRDISSIKEKPLLNKIMSFLEEYGISYDINKRVKDITENNPVVTYNNLNKLIADHKNTMYITYESYANAIKNTEE